MADLLDICRFTAGNTGTGAFEDGTADQGFLNLSGAGAVNGRTYPYRAENATRTEWEIGRGVYNSGTGKLSRVPSRSSNGNATVNFTTAPTVIITALAAEISGPLSTPQGRLSLTGGVAVTTADVAGATTIYYVPAGGQNVPVYDGSAWSMHDIGGQLALALDSNSGHTNYHQSSKNYDLFYAVVASTYYFGTGPKWDDGAVAGSNTARGTGASSTELELYNGFWVNKNSMTLRHGSGSGDTVTVPARQATLLGSFRAVADGQASDTNAKRFLSNAYNAARRVLGRYDATFSWDYTTTTWRQARGSVDNKVEMLFCLGGAMLHLDANAIVNTSVAAACRCGIGIDSTTQNSARLTSVSGATATVAVQSVYRGYPGIGYHYAAWLEMGGGSGTTTWFGDNGTDQFRSGLSGDAEC